ncbi:MAG TPA: hypothetical protein VIM41_05325 [Gammaproteobacteria bacterium]
MPRERRRIPKHELAQAVFNSVYSSREQRRRRRLAALLLTAKHTLRGLLFSWPLYLMVYAGFRTDAPVNWFLWALGMPGISISISILARGIREEYKNRITGSLLARADLLRLLRGDVA